MSHAQDLEKEMNGVTAMSQITSIYEGIASMKIAKIKDQVLRSNEFFDDLWGIYKQLRVDSLFRFGREDTDSQVIDKELYIIITAEGGFSGDIDQKLVKYMLENYDEKINDIVVIGHHGALQLVQKNITFKKYFKLPEKDQNLNVAPVMKYINAYRSASVFYQQYVSLMVQDVRRIELSRAVMEKGQNVDDFDEIISEANYIFEPSVYGVVGHLERSMMQLMIEQLILDSKLAQYASRFKAMSMSHDMADDKFNQVKFRYNRAKRGAKDERLKEMINGLRRATRVSS